VALTGYLKDWQKYVKNQIFKISFNKSSTQIMHKNHFKASMETAFKKALIFKYQVNLFSFY